MCTFFRTANAGGLLTLDGVQILLDGVSQAVGDYLSTPDNVEAELLKTPLDLMAFTHDHADHFSAGFVRRYGHMRPLPALLGPETLSTVLSGCSVGRKEILVGSVRVIPYPSRHIGDGRREIDHCSFILSGSFCVWFLGDAAPAQWRRQSRLPKPDVLIAPFSYFSTEASWRIVAGLSPKKIVLLHMPLPEMDSAQIWPAVNAVLARHPEQKILVPDMGERCFIN